MEHADHIERLFEEHGPDEATVRLNLTDDMFLRFYNWPRWQLGIPLPPDCVPAVNAQSHVDNDSAMRSRVVLPRSDAASADYAMQLPAPSQWVPPP